jgi:lipid-A-disaccharide synthase
VVYRVSPVTYWIAKRVVTVPHVAMVNLVWNQNPANRLVPELIQDDFQAARIVQELEPLLADGAARSKMMTGLKEVAAKLHSGFGTDSSDKGTTGETAIGTVAAVVLQTLGLASREVQSTS